MSGENNLNLIGPRLTALGIHIDDAIQLRRIAMTLHRWSELECGDEHGAAIERDDETGKPFMTYERGNGTRGRYPVADREAGALKRLQKIMQRYPLLLPYVQGDPRGAPLFICSKEQLAGRPIDAFYNYGVAVHK